VFLAFESAGGGAGGAGLAFFCGGAEVFLLGGDGDGFVMGLLLFSFRDPGPIDFAPKMRRKTPAGLNFSTSAPRPPDTVVSIVTVEAAPVRLAEEAVSWGKVGFAKSAGEFDFVGGRAAGAAGYGEVVGADRGERLEGGLDFCCRRVEVDRASGLTFESEGEGAAGGVYGKGLLGAGDGVGDVDIAGGVVDGDAGGVGEGGKGGAGEGGFEGVFAQRKRWSKRRGAGPSRTATAIAATRARRGCRRSEVRATGRGLRGSSPNPQEESICDWRIG